MSFDDSENGAGTVRRKFQGRGSMSALAATIERDLRDILPGALQRDRRSAKVIAFQVGSTPRAVENWRQGDNLPTIPHFMVLAKQIPELRLKVLEWLEASMGENDDDPSRVLSEIAKLLQQRGGA